MEYNKNKFFSFKKIRKNRKSKFNHKVKNKKIVYKVNKKGSKKRKLIFYKIIKIIIIFLFLSLLYKYKINKAFLQIFDLKNIHNVFNYSIQYDKYNEIIDEKYKYLQNYFCENQNENLNQEYENKIKMIKIDFNGKNNNIYIYKDKDYTSKVIIETGQYEGKYTKQCLSALEFYSKKKGLENKDIYFLDVGANIGWYSFFIGKYGYNVLSFEASKINSYILYKNYCLNKDVIVTIINKGLDEEDKKCILKIVSQNVGNGAIFCENRESNYRAFDKYTDSIELTKLSRYNKYLLKNNLALIKIDVEGDEEKVIKGGKEIVTKFHVPFIMIEFDISILKFHQTNVLEFLKFFENNGYKFRLVGFLSKEYISSEELIKISTTNTNVFIVYEKFLQ